MKRALLTVLVLGAFIVENGFDFVGSVRYFRRLTGGLGILDMLPLPDPERAHRALALLGPDGRHQYAMELITFDVLFPLALALFFRAWLSGRLRLLPWAALTLDYAENLACGLLVATFPAVRKEGVEPSRELPHRNLNRDVGESNSGNAADPIVRTDCSRDKTNRWPLMEGNCRATPFFRGAPIRRWICGEKVINRASCVASPGWA